MTEIEVTIHPYQRRGQTHADQWWKVSYDFARPFWTAFGRIAFMRAVTRDEAETRARRFLELIEGGATLQCLEVSASTFHARRRFWQRVQAARAWQRNVARGVPNDPRSL